MNGMNSIKLYKKKNININLCGKRWWKFGNNRENFKKILMAKMIILKNILK